jgi:hypothetical protein
MARTATNRWGSDSYVGFGKEAVVSTGSPWGTSVARTEFFEIIAESGGFTPSRKPISTWRSTVTPGFIDAGKKSLKTLGFPLTYQNISMVLRNFFPESGYTFGTVADPGMNTHTFKMLTTGKARPMSIEVANTEVAGNANAALLAGAYGKKLTFEFSADDIAKMTCDFIAMPETLVAKTTAVGIPSPSNYVKPATYTFTIDSETGVALELDKLSISIDTGLDDGRVKMKSATIVEPQPTGNVVVTGSFSRDWFSDAMYLKLISGATASIQIASSGPAGTSPKTANFKLTILLPAVVILGDPPAHSGPGIVGETVNFQAQDDSTNSAIKITVETDETTFA